MVDVISPPIIGAANGFITSAPVPVLHMMGIRPIILVATVMTLGRRRKTDPSIVASSMSCMDMGAADPDAWAWIRRSSDS